MSGFKLREYQDDIINQTINSNVDTLIQVPTGGGKTVISRFIALKLSFFENKRILFVAPKIILMEQALKEFKKLNPQVIHKAQKYNPYHSILVSTIQTASRRDEIYPDVIIVDEIHYGYEGRMLKQLKENHPNARIIGLSATPYDSKGILLKGFDLILDKYDMKYMINNKYLVDLKSYILTKKELISDLEKIKIIRGDYDVAELHDVMCKNSTISEIVETTKEYIEKSKKTIVFAVDINHAELLRQAYNEKGFKASALHSKTKKENNEADEISEEIEKFRRGETRVLVSVLMLTTGFDVPDTDYAIIARPTRSQNLYKQMVGRVLRIADNKTHAVLLDCGNVIKNLGMPLDPVRKIEGNEIVNKHKCSNCKSERLQLIKEEDGLYWKCKDCDERKKVEEGGYACESCCLVSSYEGIFSVEEDKVFLDCKCGHKTLISEYRGEEEFVEVDNQSGINQENKWVYELWDWALSFDILNTFFSEDIIKRKMLPHDKYELNKEVQKLLKLEEVVIFEDIDTIPFALFKLQNLKTLIFSITTEVMPDIFFRGIINLINLEEFDMTFINLREMPKEIFMLRKLKKLTLNGNNYLKTLPFYIENIENLEELNISFTHLIEIPREVFMLKNLKKITLNGNKNLKKIPVDIYNLKTLEELNISFFNLIEIPKELFRLNNLKVLDISNNSLEKISNKIGKLINLEKLDISDNNLTDISKQIGLLSKLKELNISNNKLKTLPIEIGFLEELKELCVQNNNFKKVPKGMYTLKKLERLNIKGHYFDVIPNGLVLLPKLESIDITFNNNLLIFQNTMTKVLLSRGLNINWW